MKRDIHAKRTDRWPTWPCFSMALPRGAVRRPGRHEKLKSRAVACCWAGAVELKPLVFMPSRTFVADGLTDRKWLANSSSMRLKHKKNKAAIHKSRIIIQF